MSDLVDETSHLRELLLAAREMLRAAGYEGQTLAEQLSKVLERARMAEIYERDRHRNVE